MHLLNCYQLEQYLNNYCIQNKKTNALRALYLIQELHKDQYRKEGDPFIIHPMSIARDAIALGLDSDQILTIALLHDVEEDCGINTETLGFDASITQPVHLLTKRKVPKPEKQKELQRYFTAIPNSKEATIIKLLDRKNNLSTMVNAFSYEKMLEYIEETETYCIPLLESIKQYPDLENFYYTIKGFYIPFLESFHYQHNLLEEKENNFTYQKKPIN